MKACTECMTLLERGYVVADGAEVFCSITCLSKTYSPAEYREMQKEGIAHYDIWKSGGGNE